MKKRSVKLIIVSIITILIFSTFTFSQNGKISTKSKDYFMELAFGVPLKKGGSIDKKNDNSIKKWTYYIKIYLEGDVPINIRVDLHKILNDLNSLTSNIKLEIAPEKESSNLLVYFGNGNDYAEKFKNDIYYSPSKTKNLSGERLEKVRQSLSEEVKNLVENNWGLYWMYWDDNNRILKGSIFVDMERTKTKSGRKHILMQNLAKSLGIFNQSGKYKTSIFYDEWSTTTRFQQIDKDVIRILYDKKIKPGMTKEEVIDIISEM